MLNADLIYVHNYYVSNGAFCLCFLHIERKKARINVVFRDIKKIMQKRFLQERQRGGEERSRDYLGLSRDFLGIKCVQVEYNCNRSVSG